MILRAQTEADDSMSGDVLPLKAFILYENRTAGLYAKESLDHFVNQKDLDLACDLDVCRFDLLNDSAVCESTAKQFAGADMVIVARDGRHDLPPAIGSWLARWLWFKGDHPCALIVLLCDDMASTDAVQGRIDFAQIPTQANVQVFECVRFLEQTSVDSVLGRLQYRENKSSAILQEILRQREPFSHWGIND
jgi:hypothetical protein